MLSSEVPGLKTSTERIACQDLRAQLHTYIAGQGIVRSSVEQPLRSESGRVLNWMFDLRPLLLDSAMLEVAAKLFWAEMAPLWPFQVAGVELAAVPLMVAVTLEGQRRGQPVSALIVRQKRKKYGRQNVVEGTPKLGVPLIIVDDCINSARAVGKVRIALSELGLQCRHVFTLIDFESEVSRREF